MSPVSQYFTLKQQSQNRSQNGNIHSIELNLPDAAAPRCTQRYTLPGFGIPGAPGYLDDVIY